MALHTTKTPLNPGEQVKLLEWLRKPESDILRRVLQSEVAANEVAAVSFFQKSLKTPRFLPDGEATLIKAMEAEITLKKLEALLQPDAELYTVTIAPSPI